MSYMDLADLIGKNIERVRYDHLAGSGRFDLDTDKHSLTIKWAKGEPAMVVTRAELYSGDSSVELELTEPSMVLNDTPNEPVAPLEDRLRDLLVKMKERGMAYDHHGRDVSVQMAGSVLLQWHGHLSELLPEEKP